MGTIQSVFKERIGRRPMAEVHSEPSCSESLTIKKLGMNCDCRSTQPSFEGPSSSLEKVVFAFTKKLHLYLEDYRQFSKGILVILTAFKSMEQ